MSGNAPFDARVSNLSISEGAYAHVGQQAFTLIDARSWWAIANFRETDLRNIQLGMPVDVYLMSQPPQAARFPVRVRLEQSSDYFRVGASAMVVVRGNQHGRP